LFESLNRVVQNEPRLDRDKAMIDTLKSIEIENGRGCYSVRNPRQFQ